MKETIALALLSVLSLIGAVKALEIAPNSFKSYMIVAMGLFLISTIIFPDFYI